MDRFFEPWLRERRAFERHRSVELFDRAAHTEDEVACIFIGEQAEYHRGKADAFDEVVRLLCDGD